MLTSDPNDPRLTRGVDEAPTPQAPVYLVLTEEERAKGFIRPVRRSYVHDVPHCGAVTRMSLEIAQTYARRPGFYGATYCCDCRQHLAVDQFIWDDGSGEKVGT